MKGETGIRVGWRSGMDQGTNDSDKMGIEKKEKKKKRIEVFWIFRQRFFETFGFPCSQPSILFACLPPSLRSGKGRRVCEWKMWRCGYCTVQSCTILYKNRTHTDVKSKKIYLCRNPVFLVNFLSCPVPFPPPPPPFHSRSRPPSIPHFKPSPLQNTTSAARRR